MKHIAEYDDAGIKKRLKETFLMILEENNDGLTPFDIAFTLKRNPLIVEVLLKMLYLVPDYCLTT